MMYRKFTATLTLAKKLWNSYESTVEDGFWLTS